MKLQFKSRVPPYQHVEGVQECTQEVKNGARLSSGDVWGVECGKYKRTHACNILYLCNEASVQHENAVQEQSTTISAC